MIYTECQFSRKKSRMPKLSRFQVHSIRRSKKYDRSLFNMTKIEYYGIEVNTKVKEGAMIPSF